MSPLVEDLSQTLSHLRVMGDLHRNHVTRPLQDIIGTTELTVKEPIVSHPSPFVMEYNTICEVIHLAY